MTVKKTFATLMPDKAGAFLEAAKVFSSLGLNITRVSYNKAVDTHMLFVEVCGESGAMKKAESELYGMGFLGHDGDGHGSVMLVEFKLRDVPGTLEPILELIERCNINISYLSSAENGTDYQYFRMGLFVTENDDTAALLNEASKYCGVKILDYNPTGIALDNTVFYMSFADRIAEEYGFGEDEKRELLLDSNLIMDMLTRKNSPPYKTFEYIGKFAEYLREGTGEGFAPRITEYTFENVRFTLIEPPCGSNLCVAETGGGLLCVDGGFPCCRDDSLALLRKLYPGFDGMHKVMLLTHADVDHVGIADVFDKVYVTKKCADNFALEARGEPNLREQNPVHAPYVRISKLLSGYKPIPEGIIEVIGGSSDSLTATAERIGEVRFGELCFEVYEAKGGHVRGEAFYIERRLDIAFTGDIIVNTKGFTKPQARFNRLAPFLMTSVDTDPALAAEERAEIYKLLADKKYTVFGGHGLPVETQMTKV